MLEGRSKSFLSKQTEIITAITIENYRFHNGDTLAHQTPSHPGIQKPKSKPKPIGKKIEIPSGQNPSRPQKGRPKHKQ